MFDLNTIHLIGSKCNVGLEPVVVLRQIHQLLRFEVTRLYELL